MDKLVFPTYPLTVCSTAINRTFLTFGTKRDIIRPMIQNMFRSKNQWIQIILVILSVYVGICIGVVLMRDQLLYHPNPNKSDIREAQKVIPSLREVSYQTSDGRSLYGFFTQPTRQKQVVLFLHGNSYHLNAFLSRVRPFVDVGYGVMMAEYTGFGGILGDIRQSVLEQDVRAAVRYLNRRGYANRDIILYGYSLGTYLAVDASVELGKTQPFHALVLEAPFTSLVDVAADTVYHLLPVGLLMPDGYFLIDKIGHINTRLFVAHGRQDNTIPYHQGVAVFNAAPNPKVFFSSDTANHRSLPENGFFDSLLEWLREY